MMPTVVRIPTPPCDTLVRVVKLNSPHLDRVSDRKGPVSTVRPRRTRGRPGEAGTPGPVGGRLVDDILKKPPMSCDYTLCSLKSTARWGCESMDGHRKATPWWGLAVIGCGAHV
ncbi:hypothetical protein GCM10022206_32770 [Streptomyces chiangmaiensis]